MAEMAERSLRVHSTGNADKACPLYCLAADNPHSEVCC